VLDYGVMFEALRRFGVKLGLSEVDAEDVAGYAQHKLWEGYRDQDYKRQLSVGFSIVKHRFIDMVRYNKRWGMQSLHREDDTVKDQYLQHDVTPDRQAEAREMLPLALKRLGTLADYFLGNEEEDRALEKRERQLLYRLRTAWREGPEAFQEYCESLNPYGLEEEAEELVEEPEVVEEPEAEEALCLRDPGELFLNSVEFERMRRRLMGYAARMSFGFHRVSEEDLVGHALLELVKKQRRMGEDTLMDDKLRWQTLTFAIRNRFYDSLRTWDQKHTDLGQTEDVMDTVRALRVMVRRTPEDISGQRADIEMVRLGVMHMPGYLSTLPNVARDLHVMLLVEHLRFSWDEVAAYFGETINRNSAKRGLALMRGWCHALREGGFPPQPGPLLNYWKKGHDAGITYLRATGALPPLPKEEQPPEQRILDAFKALNEPTGARTISEHASLPYTTTRNIIHRLHNEGALVRHTRGKYLLAPQQTCQDVN
jgi:hypothetical protein